MEAATGYQSTNLWLPWIQYKSQKPGIENIKTVEVPVFFWMVDNQGLVVLSEGDGPLELNISSREIIGKSIFDVYADIPQILGNVHRAMTGEMIEEVIEFSDFVWESRYYPARDSSGKISGVIGVAFNITDQQKQRWKQGIVLDIAASLRKVETRDEMSGVILNELENLLRVSGAALVMRNSSGNEMFVEEATGVWDSMSGQFLSIENHAWITRNTEKIVFTGQPHIENDFLLLGHSEVDAHAVAGVPICAQEDVIGVLWVGCNNTITDDEVHLLIEIGDIVAKAFIRTEQHEQTERRLRRLSALHAIDRAITSSFDLGIVLNILLDQVVAQLEVDAADVFMNDPQTQMLEFANGRGFNKQNNFEQMQLNIGEGLAGRVARERSLVSIPYLPLQKQLLVRSSLVEDEKFVSYYGIPLIVKGKIKGFLEVFNRRPLPEEVEWLDFYKTLATQAAIALDNAELFNNIRHSNMKLERAYHATLEGWVRALDLRDKETEGHAKRVTMSTLKLAKVMGIDEEELIHISRGALLHDIGKLGVPDYILNKPGPLSEEEWVLMRKHPTYAKEMLSQIEFLRPALDIPFCHHERWDGTGYPRGLVGTQIPLAARIFSVIDVWDALSSDRAYRKAWPQEKVEEYIQNQAGKLFDPQVVQAWVEVFIINKRG